MKIGFRCGRLRAASPLILFCLLGLAPPADAQLQSATIQGMATDQTGGGLPGVSVTTTNFRTTSQMIRTMGGSVL